MPLRKFNEKWNANNATTKAQRLKWFQGETVLLQLTARAGREAYDLTDPDTVVTWTITGWNDTNVVYAATVGVITDAATGLCQFELPPVESNLPVGTYHGYVKAIIQDGETVEDIGVLCEQIIKVLDAPDGTAFEWAGPIAQQTTLNVTIEEFKGDWDPAFNNGEGYTTGMSVHHNGSTWWSKVDNNTEEPGLFAANWHPLVSKGEQGVQGVQGEQGLQGVQGEAGPEGQQGIQGLQGEVGPEGPVGPEGSSAVYFMNFNVNDDGELVGTYSAPATADSFNINEAGELEISL